MPLTIFNLTHGKRCKTQISKDRGIGINQTRLWVDLGRWQSQCVANVADMAPAKTHPQESPNLTAEQGPAAPGRVLRTNTVFQILASSF